MNVEVKPVAPAYRLLVERDVDVAVVHPAALGAPWHPIEKRLQGRVGPPHPPGQVVDPGARCHAHGAL